MSMVKLSLEGRIRTDILTAALNAKKIGAHIAPSLSLVEICSAVLKNYYQGKDVFVLSKAHGALGYYSAMHQMKLITDEQFESFEADGGEFPGQPSRTGKNHIDYSGGSLGMGLPYAVGRAWADRDARVYVILGDGELNEGSNWEAASVAAQQGLGNIYAVVDCNGLQSDGQCGDILNQDLEAIWAAYGWDVKKCDGHSVDEIEEMIVQHDRKRPLVILADTVKGKGVSFMENNNEWHHHELKQEQYEAAMAEIGERYGLCEE